MDGFHSWSMDHSSFSELPSSLPKATFNAAIGLLIGVHTNDEQDSENGQSQTYVFIFFFTILSFTCHSIPSQFLKKYCDFPGTDLYEFIQSCEPLPIVRDIRPRVLLGFGMGMGIGRIGCMSITQPSHSRPW